MAIRTTDWNGASLASGRYQITAKLGEGGMGSVYRALDRNLDAEVVIKVPRQAMLEDPEFADRFTREIRSLVKLSHPGIVKVTDVGDWEGHPFAVMQFLPGGSLEDRQKGGAEGLSARSDPRDLSGWLTGIADALDYVHSQGYVHRDVKPGNILFDAQGHPFLSDFGVAKVLAAAADAPAARTSMTGAGMVLGTPEYMAPELIMGEDIDGRVDQYALAVTVYEMLCGRRPFEHETKTKLLVLHTTKAPPPLTELLPSLPDRLSQAVLKGMAKEPNARYPHCAALALAVTTVADAVPSAHEERVRIKCQSCGRSLQVASSVFAKLKLTGQRVPCPSCKTPIRVTDESVAPSPPAQGPPRSSTVKLPAQGTSGEPAAPPRSSTVKLPAQGTSGEPAVPPRSGTVKLPAQGTSGEPAVPPRSGTVKLPAQGTSGEPAVPPRSSTVKLSAQEVSSGLAPPPRSSTVKLSAQEVSGELAAPPRSSTVKLSAQEVSDARASAPGRGPTVALPALGNDDPVYMLALDVEPVRSSPPPPPPVVHAPQTVPASALSLMVIGIAGSAVLCVTVLALGLWWFVLRSPGPQKVSESPVVASIPPLSNKTPSPFTKPSSQPQVKTRPLPSAVPVAIPDSPSTPSPSVAEKPQLADLNPGGGEPGPEPEKPSLNDQAPTTAGLSTKKPEGMEPDSASRTNTREEWSPQIASRKPVKVKEINLARILSSPQKYANQLVVPDGMYCLSDYPRTRPDGSLEFAVNQSRVELRNGTPAIESLKTDVVELEPKLAPRLNEARRNVKEPLNSRPAILTFWVTSQGACRLVNAEFLIDFAPRYNRNGKPDVEYFVLRASPEGVTSEKGLDDDWETVPRMLHIRNVLQKRLLALKNFRDSVKQDQINREMGSMFNAMMRNTAVQNARDQQMIRNVSGLR